MDHVKSLLEEAAELEGRAVKLREAARLIGGTTGRKTRKIHLGGMKKLISILKKDKTIKISDISKRTGAAKPTVYTWLKKKDIFTRKDGIIGLKEVKKDAKTP